MCWAQAGAVPGALPSCRVPELGARHLQGPRMASGGCSQGWWMALHSTVRAPSLPCRPGERGWDDGCPVPAHPPGPAPGTGLHRGPTPGLQGSTGGLHETLRVLQADPPPLTCSSWSPVLLHMLVRRLEGGKDPPDPLNFFFPLFFTFRVPAESLKSLHSFVWKCCRREAAPRCSWGEFGSQNDGSLISGCEKSSSSPSLWGWQGCSYPSWNVGWAGKPKSSPRGPTASRPAPNRGRKGQKLPQTTRGCWVGVALGHPWLAFAKGTARPRAFGHPRLEPNPQFP